KAEGAAGARVDRPLDAAQSGIGNLLARAAAAVDEPEASQPLERRLVTLAVAVLPRDLAIPMKAQRLERSHDILGGAGHCARRVDVLDSQQPLAALRARVEPAR